MSDHLVKISLTYSSSRVQFSNSSNTLMQRLRTVVVKQLIKGTQAQLITAWTVCHKANNLKYSESNLKSAQPQPLQVPLPMQEAWINIIRNNNNFSINTLNIDS